MSQLSFPSFDSCLLVRDAHGRYLPASADDILEAARQVIDRKMRRGAEFTSPAAVKEYLRTKLASFEHEVFVVLFMDTRDRSPRPCAVKARRAVSSAAPAGRTNPALGSLTAPVRALLWARAMNSGKTVATGPTGFLVPTAPNSRKAGLRI
ncbi:DNA repair protein RadC [Serratia marcescens]|uniref:DNA repair protein RadC n=1 Tax=Serratia marcescens TaxID=615 RepID=UPI000AE8BBFD